MVNYTVQYNHRNIIRKRLSYYPKYHSISVTVARFNKSRHLESYNSCSAAFLPDFPYTFELHLHIRATRNKKKTILTGIIISTGTYSISLQLILSHSSTVFIWPRKRVPKICASSFNGDRKRINFLKRT